MEKAFRLITQMLLELVAVERVFLCKNESILDIFKWGERELTPFVVLGRLRLDTD